MRRLSIAPPPGKLLAIASTSDDFPSLPEVSGENQNVVSSLPSATNQVRIFCNLF